jgi:hypothetical protein
MNSFLLCVIFLNFVWVSTSCPMLWLSGERQSRRRQMHHEIWREVMRNAKSISICINVTSPVLREAQFST